MRSARDKSKRLTFFASVVAAGALLLGLAAPASAAPQWQIDSLANTTAAQGSEHEFLLRIANIGDEFTDGGGDPIKLSASLPTGMSAKTIVANLGFDSEPATPAIDPFALEDLGWTCTGDGPGPGSGVEGAHNLSCELFESVEPHAALYFGFPILLVTEVDAGASGLLTTHFSLSGAGLAESTTAEVTRIAPDVQFGIDSADVQLSDAKGKAFTQAGGHPFEYTTTLDFNTEINPTLGLTTLGYPVEPTRDIAAELPVGFLGNPQAADRCDAGDLLGENQSPPSCPVDSQIGTALVQVNVGPASGNRLGPLPLFNMVPPPGVPARFGVNVYGTVVTFDARLRSESDYGISVTVPRIPAALNVAGSSLTLWGAPAADVHDPLRACPGKLAPEYVQPDPPEAASCKTDAAERAFLRMPTSCTAPGEGLRWPIAMDSWNEVGALLSSGAPDLSDPAWESTEIEGHEAPGYPLAPSEWGAEGKGVDGCPEVPVAGSLSAKPTSLDTESSTGLEVHVEVPNPGLNNPASTAIASSDIKRVKVALPQGVTINPSQAEGLGVCSPAQYESSRLEFHPDGQHGCPSDSKVGTVSVKTPLLEEQIPGNVYIAAPFDNPFDSLLAIYVVLEEPMRGILVKLPGEVRTNEQTGKIEAEFDDLPQTPFSSFDFKFREGARAPLVTPPTCGSYETVTEIEGWSDPGNHITSTSSFEITRGIGGGPCPKAGTPDFKPTFSAGAINNSAGDFSPFVMRLTRKDGEQDMTRFSATLPPGVLGKLAGVDKCPGSAVAIARSKSGLQERANPSCPANSEIGRSVVGAGVGSVLTHVPGKVYLGGPFNGRPLSVIAITPAVAGPFDVGTVVVQVALTLNPKTAEVEVDGTASDPIPHMLKGIPAKLRDLRVYVDRPDFTLNPTSCDPSATEATLFGGGGNAFTSTDDVPVFLEDRFQAANCAALGFKPKLGLKLKGGTSRGDFPALQATYRPRPGDANVEGLVVRLPRSAFLEQGHIRTVCTRVQFAADACPKGSQYGFIRAFTPLLDEPLAGPVYLRSSNHKLPDLVFDLHGLVDVEVATRIDSVRGGVRASVETVPDAPLTKVVLRMQGGKKGLIVNSRNLCGSTNRANVASNGHNGKISDFNPAMKPDCGAKRKAKRAAAR